MAVVAVDPTVFFVAQGALVLKATAVLVASTGQVVKAAEPGASAGLGVGQELRVWDTLGPSGLAAGLASLVAFRGRRSGRGVRTCL